ncbi:transposase [Chryseobacterium arthrosphaerae]|uniref:transposase n=1 Tax=Chryseobacterium arthrosphaerae TaxID=651561 RepID=UPI001E3D022A|nr:transposase [Chryseobacterium arthrosphaerae]UEQ76092.1 transposase [Chryseobacterium arthrosphaerae]WES97431.1 transposase [Chryseobacterium arthrosphaerae]
MTNNFKNIHIGEMINNAVKDQGIDSSRICSFFKCSINEIDHMYECESLEADLLLKWSKLLEYDLFRIYSQHLIMYAPPTSKSKASSSTCKSPLPTFRKSLYTREIIDFVLEQISTGTKTKSQIVEEYKIPKTTLHKWISKYHTL